MNKRVSLGEAFARKTGEEAAEPTPTQEATVRPEEPLQNAPTAPQYVARAQLNVSIPAEVRHKARLKALRSGTTVTDVVSAFLTRWGRGGVRLSGPAAPPSVGTSAMPLAPGLGRPITLPAASPTSA